jgi:acylphosphatase
MIICKRVEIFGRVQGVWYRGSTEKKANELGLFGWVRNRADGSVEAVFQGESDTIDKMLHWCDLGPTLARVDRVDVTDEPLEQNFSAEFKVLY